MILTNCNFFIDFLSAILVFEVIFIKVHLVLLYVLMKEDRAGCRNLNVSGFVNSLHISLKVIMNLKTQVALLEAEIKLISILLKKMLGQSCYCSFFIVYRKELLSI